MKSKLRLIFLIILTSMFFLNCNQKSPVPYVYVNFYLSLNNLMYNDLNTIGGSVLLTNEGYKGLIIIRTDFDQFDAYDATCTFDPNDKWGRIELEKSGIFAIDTVCKSHFNLLYGAYPDQGPATIPLKMYMAEYNGSTNTLFVHN